MKNLRILLQLFMLATFAGCTTMSEPAKSKLANGYYATKDPRSKKQQRYVFYKNDTIRVYQLNKSDNKTIDTARATSLAFPEEIDNAPPGKFTFSKQSVSLNFQTILFKFRPASANIPNQLSTEFNFNLYIGHSTDIYHIRYQANPLQTNKRKFDHIAYSYGFFTGFGETPVSASVTRNQITYNYDGLVWLNGVGGILGTRGFTLGAGVGIDQLLDRNHDVWIYQRKPWIGLLLGIKLK